MSGSSVIALRLALRANGFDPVVVAGKAPVMKEWEKRFAPTVEELRMWTKSYTTARNTGVLCKFVPGLDIDFTLLEAAEALEALAREHFEERGDVFVRIGKPPKRLIPLRTDEPFEKLVRTFIAPDGSIHKIEILGNGQQFVIAGVHPDTQRPYSWNGVDIGTVRRDQLPYVRCVDCEAFLTAATRLLVEDFGYVSSEQKKPNGDDKDGDGHADVPKLVDNILHGRDLHDSLRDYAMSLISSGTPERQAKHILRTLMQASSGPHDERWTKRLKDIPRAVRTAKEKLDEEDCPDSGVIQLPPPAAPDTTPAENGQAEPAGQEQGAPATTATTLEDVHRIFHSWFGDAYDLDVIGAVMAAGAIERLNGDPIWLFVISGPGNTKTESVQSLSGAGAHVTSTISSEGALLSATSQKGRTRGATGGLLRKVGTHGIIVIKDVTSLLSVDRNVRNRIFAALREVYDGRWERNVGNDGGRTLTWEGRIVVIGAVTTAWDTAHGAIGMMGDRFVLIRSDSTVERGRAGHQAISNTGNEKNMRAELSKAVGDLIGRVTNSVPLALSEKETEDLVALADLVTYARTAVERDYRGDVIDAHAPEMPTRFARQLAQLVRGGVALGMSHEDAMRLARRCARDSIPQLRLIILRDLVANPDSRVFDVCGRIEKPYRTVQRELEALHTLGLASCCSDKITTPTGETKIVWRYSLGMHISQNTLNSLPK